MIELHYIKLLEKKQQEVDQLRSILFDLLKRNFVSEEEKQLIINKFFNNGEEPSC